MRQLGAEVVVVEHGAELLRTLDVDLRDAIGAQLHKVGVKVFRESVVSVVSAPVSPHNGETPADRDVPETVHVRITPTERRSTRKGSASAGAVDIWCDAVLSATGRDGNTAGMNLEAVGCQLNKRCEWMDGGLSVFLSVAVSCCVCCVCQIRRAPNTYMYHMYLPNCQ